MEIRIIKKGDELYARCAGELDQHSAVTVRERLDDALDRGGIRRLVFDLSGVTFMDSSGIGVILGRYKKLASHGGSICVINAQKGVERVLRMSGVYKLCTERRSV